VRPFVTTFVAFASAVVAVAAAAAAVEAAAAAVAPVLSLVESERVQHIVAKLLPPIKEKRCSTLVAIDAKKNHDSIKRLVRSLSNKSPSTSEKNGQQIKKVTLICKIKNMLWTAKLPSYSESSTCNKRLKS
jgi:hypothetical protein